MSDLPSGWEWANLGEIVEFLDNLRVPLNRTERRARPGGVPYYGATGRVDWINEAIFDEDLVLLGEDGVQFLEQAKQKSYLVSGPCWVNNHAHVLRCHPTADRRYITHWLNFIDYRGLVTGTTRLKLTKSAATGIPVIVPPIAEQQRIVTALESHLSRLDAGGRFLSRTEPQRQQLVRQSIISAVDSAEAATFTTVGKAGTVDLGRQRHPDWHTGPNMQSYLRVANVFEDRIDLEDVKTMHFSADTFERFELLPNDILLNEGQSPEYLGRPAMYRGEPGKFAFTNSLLRFRAGEGVLPEWALLVFRRHMHARRFIKEVRITTNIAHLSAARFKSVEFPIPPLTAQARIVAEVKDKLADADRLRVAVDLAARRAARLRRSLLAEAFAGRLVPQDPTDEPASVLLDRIRAERAAQAKPRRSRRSAP